MTVTIPCPTKYENILTTVATEARVNTYKYREHFWRRTLSDDFGRDVQAMCVSEV